MLRPFARRLERFSPLSVAETEILEQVSANGTQIGPDQDLIREGDSSEGLLVLLEGFACRYKYLPSGQRQITAYLVPGDTFGLQHRFADEVTCSVSTISRSTAAWVSHGVVARLMEDHPGIARAMQKAAAVDEGVLNEWLVNIGRRTSYERIAHLFCELFARFRAIGRVQGNGFELPITQQDMADTMALSVVHVNRTLQALRHDGLIKWERRRLDILDTERLAARAMFNPNYLRLGGDTRYSIDVGADRRSA